MAINSDGGLTDLAIISIFFTVMEMKSTKLISVNVVSITVFENYKIVAFNIASEASYVYILTIVN